jgi:hypothetical protein
MSMPVARIPSATAAAYLSEVRRQSRPTLTSRFPDSAASVPKACPSERAKAASKSRSATPRMSYSRKMAGFS